MKKKIGGEGGDGRGGREFPEKKKKDRFLLY